MRAVIQRVKSAGVFVDGKEVSSIKKGLLVLLGIKGNDASGDISYIIKKIIDMRIFEDEFGKMNLSVADIGGEILVVSQFTLYGDMRKGKRPSFTKAGSIKDAEKIYNEFAKEISEKYPKVKFGQFQAMMQVNIINDGPVTILIDSEKSF